MTDSDTILESELSRERAYVAGLYARLDELIAQSREALDSVRIESVGGNHQSRTERDAFARLYEDRIRSLSGVDDRLVFGRLDPRRRRDRAPLHRPHRPARRRPAHRCCSTGARPQSSAFYQATAATPDGRPRPPAPDARAAARSIRLEDEVFDAELLDARARRSRARAR